MKHFNCSTDTAAFKADSSEARHKVLTVAGLEIDYFCSTSSRCARVGLETCMQHFEPHSS